MIRSITVYTRPDCVQCRYTKRMLDDAELAYTEEPIDEKRRALFVEMGYATLPVVVVTHDFGDDEVWCGFRIEKLRGLKAA